MSEGAKTLRLSKVAKEFNLSLGKIVEFLAAKGRVVESNPNAKIGDNLFSFDAMEALTSHSWPGNVRELANVIEHATIVCDGPPITSEHLPRRFGSRSARPTAIGPTTLRDLEMQAIHESLDRHDGNKPAVAEELGVSLKTLYNKLNQATSLEKSA